MSHCKTCKHWEPSPNEGAGWGFCNLAEADSEKPINPATLAYARDGDAYHAWLVTHETFGCVQHEAHP
jgi:hypothetical protein